MNRVRLRLAKLGGGGEVGKMKSCSLSGSSPILRRWQAGRREPRSTEQPMVGPGEKIDDQSAEAEARGAGG